MKKLTITFVITALLFTVTKNTIVYANNIGNYINSCMGCFDYKGDAAHWEASCFVNCVVGKINERLNILEILPTSLNNLEEKILTQLQNLQTSLQSNIDTVKTTRDQCSADAKKTEERTNEGLASASEEIKSLMEELRKEREEREKLMKQIEERDKAREEEAKKRKKFEKRFNHALFDTNNFGEPRDSRMRQIFEEAYKESPKFKKLLNFLRTKPKIIEQIIEAETQLGDALLEFLDEHEEWQEVIYATIQLELAIGDGNEQPAIGYNLPISYTGDDSDTAETTHNLNCSAKKSN